MVEATEVDGVGEPSTPPVVVDHPEAGIGLLTLSRPRSRNPLSMEMMGALRAAIDDAATDDDVRALVIAAEGTVFCTGHDLKQMQARRADADGGRAYFKDVFATCSALMQAIVTCPKPVIAAVQGPATAAGCQLVATADLAVANETAWFGTPGVNIGLFCSTPMVALSRAVPRKKAMEMLLLGETMSAAEAEAYGLVNTVVPAGNEREAAMRMARTIVSKSPLTIAVGKRAFYDQVERHLADAYDHASRVMTDNMMACDANEGIVAFLNKRTPQWSGR